MTISGVKYVLTCLNFYDLDLSKYSLGHKTLEKLDLQFGNATSILLAPDIFIPYIAISDRFPSLSTLVLRDFIWLIPLGNLFGELPETLTSLTAVSRHNEFICPELSLRSIANLPRHLKSLELGGMKLYEPWEDQEFDFAGLFPPNLRYLDLETVESHKFLNYCPPELTILRAKIRDVADVLVWKASKIPRGLVELKIDMELDWKIDMDVPLPSSLESIDFGSNWPFSDATTLDDLPQKLKCINASLTHFLARQRSPGLRIPEVEIYKRFPDIEHVVVLDNCDLACIPRRKLKKLELIPSRNIVFPLPSSLVDLNIYFCPSSTSFANFPSTLRSLTITCNHANMYFRAWTAPDFAVLVSTLSLESFTIDFGSTVSPSCLAPLQKMETLKKISIKEIPFHGLMKTHKWLPKCLPRDLQSLSLDYDEGSLRHMHGDSDKPFDDGFLQYCDLASVTPHLKSLKIKCRFPNLALLHRSFDALPSGLLKLDLKFDNAELDPEAMSLLPRSLRELRLTLKRQEQDEISNQHFEGLPEALQKFSFEFDATDSIDANVFEILPQSIVQSIRYFNFNF